MKLRFRLGLMLAFTAGATGGACECSDRSRDDVDATIAGSGTAEVTTEDTASTAETPEGTVDVSRFIGVFHNEHWLVPLGREVDFPGGASLANLEIRADGTASMTMETCSELDGTRHFEWRWEARTGPRLEFLPQPEDGVLSFMSFAELESLFAYPSEPCAFQFEADGVPITTETFRPGRACWVNRCEEPSWMIEIDHCEGEEPPPCE